ncbi:MAG: hypothetical protein MJ252_02270, partial [archaeon]|nr:hypothetical protein [archaeon]
MEEEYMPVSKKAKTHKGKVHLESLMPKLIEDPKQGLFINTSNSSEIMRMVLDDLYLTRKDFSKKLTKKEEIFNLDVHKNDVEYLCQKNNCAFFTFTNDTKKKPMHLTFGLIYNDSILDSFEFEVTNYIPIEYFSKNIQISSAMKPVLIFQGEIFETETKFERFKNYLIDYFKQIDIEYTTISDLKRIVVVSCDTDENKTIKIRNYQIDGKIKEGNLENLSLTEIGPSLDLREKNIQLADDETYRKSRKEPKQIKPKKVKNVETNMLGIKRGRLHLAKQNLNAVSLKKYKKILGKKKKIGKERKEDNEEIDL